MGCILMLCGPTVQLQALSSAGCSQVPGVMARHAGRGCFRVLRFQLSARSYKAGWRMMHMAVTRIGKVMITLRHRRAVGAACLKQQCALACAAVAYGPSQDVSFLTHV